MSSSSETTVTIPVIGMSCAACQSHVERALRQTPGVHGAEVNLMTHTARVVFNPLVARPQELVEAVKNSGYDSSLPSGENSDAIHSDAHMHHAESSQSALRLRALVTLGLAAVAMLVSMPMMQRMEPNPGLLQRTMAHLFPFLFRVPSPVLELLLLIMTVAGIVLAAGEVYKPAWSALLHRTTNMNTLVAIGTVSALLYSTTATLAPSLFLNHGLRPEVYYESVLFILAFLMFGRWLEARAKTRTQDALKSFLQLQPQTARVRRDGKELELPVSAVQIADIVVLRPGERVPVDGLVLSGAGGVDESLITGESLPVPRGPGDRLVGGSLNYDGALEYRATSLAGGGTLAQMLRLMQDAQSSRAPTQQLADKVSAIFVPVVLGIAVLTFAAWLALDHGNLGFAFAAAITVLVIACPCAMGLAVPAALTVAIGRGAQLGVLFKNGDALERLAHIDTVVFDKTGTLTEGHPRIDRILPVEGTTPAELLRLAASLEQRSEHPLARAVLLKSSEIGLDLSEAANVRAIPGKGLMGTVDGHQVAVGNPAMFLDLGIQAGSSPNALAIEGSTLLVSVDGEYRGYLSARDEVRSGAADAVAQMKKRGLRTIMLTGDNAMTAEAVANRTGIDEFYAALGPEQKLQQIRSLQTSGRKVAMVGDGINDAAALAQADAGLAIGTGTDLAREAGDVILLRGEPLSIVDTLDLARSTLRTMRENLSWAIGYNLLGIPIAAGVLYPVFGILLTPAVASAAMALSSISVLANSLRLRSFRAGLSRTP
jgi:Cu+-exporting ATPase